MEKTSMPDTELFRVLQTAIDRFAGWLGQQGYASYDPYDLWGTRYGLLARRLYYAKHPLGLPLTAPLVLTEIVWPGIRRWVVQKDRYATADAQLVLAFLNLHWLSLPPGAGAKRGRKGEDLPAGEGQRQASSPWLERAVALADELLKTSIPGYSGLCWGYPFDWQNNKGLWRRNTPYITCTPYCFEAFLGLYDATGETRYRDYAVSVARFVHDDLKDTPVGKEAAAASYGPEDTTQVINASAYRAWVLFEAAARLGLTDYVGKAQRNLRFILQSQREDGAWLYGLDTAADRFIDHFHTCFVLKNLHKLNRHLRDDRVQCSVQRGYEYYRRALFGPEDLPKSFAIQPRMQVTRLEMYNVAEAMTLGAWLQRDIPEAGGLARQLAHRLATEYQLPAGHFVTRVFMGGFRHKLPFLRWPQAQLFYGLTNLQLSLRDGTD